MNVWFQDWALQIGEQGYWQIGAFELWVRRRKGEWRAAFEATGNLMDSTLDLRCPSDEIEAPDSAEYHRFAAGDEFSSLRLAPATPDRQVVVRPETTLHIPAGQETLLFVSIPLWLQLQFADIPHPLLDIPMLRPSDTWFGVSTARGELCYSSRTKAKLQLSDVATVPTRALVAIRIRNLAGSDLLISRMNLPVTYLSILADESGRLWTESILVENTAGKEPDNIEIIPGPPEHAPAAQMVSPARDRDSSGLLQRALNSVLG